VDLARDGSQVIRQDPAFFVPFPGGRAMARRGDERDLQEIARFSRRDADAYHEFHAALERVGDFVKPLLFKAPPRIDGRAPRDLWDLLTMGLAARRLAGYDLQLLVQLASLGIADVLDTRFESEELKAFLCSQAVIGAYGGVHQPGTAFLLLHDVFGGVEGAAGVWGVVVGGMGAITQALASAARERGVVIRTGAPVGAIELDDAGRVAGVRLRSGEVLPADVVVSNATPRRTFLEMLPHSALPEPFVQHMERFKDLGASL